MRTKIWGMALAAAAAAAHGATLETDDQSSLARAFGALPWVESISLSPDGRHALIITPGTGLANSAVVQDLTTGDLKTAASANGQPLRLSFCGWTANDRLLCGLQGTSRVEFNYYSWSRFVAIDSDGSKIVPIGSGNAATFNDGFILDWLTGTDGKILMGRRQQSGAIDIETVDTRSGVGTSLKLQYSGNLYFSDGKGAVRLIGNTDRNYLTAMTGGMNFTYQPSGSNDWLPFSKTQMDDGLRPVIVDGTQNAAFALQRLDGRLALYRVAMDGSLKTDLVFARPDVDVDGVEVVGRDHRVIGARYYTDRRQVAYIDPAYRALAAGLTKVLPQLPIIVIEGASADERKLLIYAASDIDPGRHFLFDRDSHRLTELAQERPQLAHTQLVEQKSLTFPAADGTMIPAYLLLPAKGDGRHLPAIVLPRGGTAERDVWGFNWIAQYFAARGYAVIQPQYRGSSGYGADFRGGNSVKSWRTSVNDVADAGRWLVRAGIADPEKLAIFGWSWGGYQSLQVNYVAPDLFKAVVAIAPVTDLRVVRERNHANRTDKVMDEMLGSVANAIEGSPVEHAAAFMAPVLILYGEQDTYVSTDHPKKMDAALHAAGKQSRLIVYPGVGNGLVDGTVRADMLMQADNFMTKAFATAGR